MRGNAGRTVFVISAMLAILLLFTFPMWSSSRLLYQGDASISDLTEYHFPMRSLLSDYLKRNAVPIWNPHMGCGYSLLAEGQSGLLYPMNLITFKFLSATLAFNLSAILSLFLALVFSNLLFRHYGMSRPAALFSAVAFSFCGFVMAKLKFIYMVNSVCWIPLAVYGLEKALAARNLGYLFLTTLALAMQVLAGGPQVFLITLTAIALIFLWRFLDWLRGRDLIGIPINWRNAALPVLGLGLCILLALAVAAPQLLPQLKGFSLSNRNVVHSFDLSLGLPMQPRNLVQFVSPYQYGNPARNTYDLNYDYFWENIAYPGLLTLILAVIAVLWLSRRDRTLQMWLAVGLLCLLLSLGDNTPLARVVWNYVPGFKLFRFWQRYLIIVVLAVTVVAGKGLDLILSRFKDNRAWFSSVVVLVFAVLLADLALFSYNQVSTIDTRRMLEENRTVQWLREHAGEEGGAYRIAALGDIDMWHAAVKQSGGWLGEKELFYQFMELLPPNDNCLFKIDGAIAYSGYGPFRQMVVGSVVGYGFARNGGWDADLTDSALNIMAMENVMYLVTPYVLREEGLSEVATLDTDVRGVTLRIYSVPEPLPRVYLTQEYEALEMEETVGLPFLIAAFHDGERSRSRVILEKQPLLRYGPGPAGDARIVEMDDRRVFVDVDSPGGGILVLSNTYDPEWHVLVDGEEREMLRANLAFSAVELEPGAHAVEFVFRPSSCYYGIPICVAASLLVFLLLLQHKRTGFLDLDRRRTRTGRREVRGGSPSCKPSSER